jgi:hypothetical protein
MPQLAAMLQKLLNSGMNRLGASEKLLPSCTLLVWIRPGGKSGCSEELPQAKSGFGGVTLERFGRLAVRNLPEPVAKAVNFAAAVELPALVWTNKGIGL